MDLPGIVDEMDYQTCLLQARLINNDEKNIICPNSKYVFHAELEIHLNGKLSNYFERWFLYFEQISLPSEWKYYFDIDDSNSIQILQFPPDKLILYGNAKTKYCCVNCEHQWTSARGRAIFQAEFSRMNKYNFLFVYLSTQQCRFCEREIQPLWYLNETIRVMKNVCRILLERFYSDSSSSFFEEENKQRRSETTGHHQRNLCPACRNGSCF